MAEVLEARPSSVPARTIGCAERYSRRKACTAGRGSGVSGNRVQPRRVVGSI